MRSLVTGGAGFIGSNLADALLERGDEVTVIDDLSTGRRENLAGALERGTELVEADIADAEAVGEVVAGHRPEAVFHLAAQMDVRRSVLDPGFDARVNVVGTANVLEAVRRDAPGAALVFASTGGAIYGEGEGRDLPFGEDSPLAPEAPYGQSKLAGEGYVGFYRRMHGLAGVSLRLGNVYGPRQDPLGEAGVVAIFCGRLRDGGCPTIFGDGRQTRDFVYVGDVVAAMLAAAERLDGGASGVGEVYNVGTGRETTVLELAETLASIGGRDDFDPELAPARAGEIQRCAIDPGKAGADLGWHAATGVDEGLRITLEGV
ncbi:MAG TPA: NAD-dependent epimerase/dehydratase family protein [Solirubrobacterales bacterium]